MKKQLKYLLILLCGALPVTAMTTHKIASPIFYAISLSCLILLLFRPASYAGGKVLHNYRGVFLAYCMPIIAVAVSMIGHGHWSGTDFESALRYSLGLPLVLIGLMQIHRHHLKQILFGVYIAAICSTVYIVYLAYPKFLRPDNIEIYNLVTYSSLMLLLVVLTAFSLNLPITSRPNLERATKWLVLVLTFGGFILTQTRTGWLAIPLYIVLGLVLAGRFQRPLRAIGWLIILFALIVAIGSSSSSLRLRVMQGYNETTTCAGIENNTTNNSVCIRFQLWRAAWTMFEQNPLIGLGDSSLFKTRMETKSQPAGIVSKFVSKNFGEPHNDMLHALSTFGPLGGLALLLVYFAPSVIFIRRLSRRYPMEIRAAAAMGSALCLGFAVYGLTEFMFRSMRTVGFYTMLVALFLALSDPGKYERDQIDSSIN